MNQLLNLITHQSQMLDVISYITTYHLDNNWPLHVSIGGIKMIIGRLQIQSAFNYNRSIFTQFRFYKYYCSFT